MRGVVLGGRTVTLLRPFRFTVPCTEAGEAFGVAERISATAPVTWGAAMDVPSRRA